MEQSATFPIDTWTSVTFGSAFGSAHDRARERERDLRVEARTNARFRKERILSLRDLEEEEGTERKFAFLAFGSVGTTFLACGRDPRRGRKRERKDSLRTISKEGFDPLFSSSLSLRLFSLSLRRRWTWERRRADSPTIARGGTSEPRGEAFLAWRRATRKVRWRRSIRTMESSPDRFDACVRSTCETRRKEGWTKDPRRRSLRCWNSWRRYVETKNKTIFRGLFFARASFVLERNLAMETTHRKKLTEREKKYDASFDARRACAFLLDSDDAKRPVCGRKHFELFVGTSSHVAHRSVPNDRGSSRRTRRAGEFVSFQTKVCDRRRANFPACENVSTESGRELTFCSLSMERRRSILPSIVDLIRRTDASNLKLDQGRAPIFGGP